MCIRSATQTHCRHAHTTQPNAQTHTYEGPHEHGVHLLQVRNEFILLFKQGGDNPSLFASDWLILDWV